MTNDAAEIVLDAHAHVHTHGSVDAVLRAAAENLAALAASPEAVLGVVLMRAGAQPTLGDVVGQAQRAGWKCAVEPGWALCAREHGVYLFDGRQIVTAEGLEILAAGSGASVLREGAPLRDTIDAANEAGLLAMIAWGFGKWWGRRGKAVLEVVRTADPSRIALCDQAGRPRGVPEHPAFALARERGVRVLAGSDPLRIASHQQQIGRYATRLRGRFDAGDPAGSLMRLIRGAPVESVGQRRSLSRALCDQVALRVAAGTAP